MTPHRELRCSFCCKDRKQWSHLITGPSVAICNECIGLCNEIIAEEAKKAATTNLYTSRAMALNHCAALEEDTERQLTPRKVWAVKGFPMKTK